MSSELFDKYRVSFKKGELVFTEGELGSEMFIIQSGKVRIFKNIDGFDQTLTVLEKGDFFGEMSILEGMPRSASAEAEEDCDLIKINSANFVAMIKSNIEIAIRIMRKLSLRLREANVQIEKLMHASTEMLSLTEAGAKPKSRKDAQEVKAYLVSTMSGKTFPIIKSESYVGRVDRVTGAVPDIDLSDEDPKRFISRRHAKIVKDDENFQLVEEIGTVNGTFLNNQRLSTGSPAPLKNGDTLTFANITLTFYQTINE
ncbi:cyclic nucleotide-binding domain-containing protein [bacterium]|nr:cyclic nucleotide-binding domain-containing protein [bacterium]MCI0605896.1 cyclic nucleotide-binding domain-containing protein [bacterium]